MSLVRRTLPVCLLVLAFAAQAGAGTKPKKPVAPKAPQGLHGFLLRADEPLADTFPRTPSFAWNPVAAATGYDLELSTSSLFGETAKVWAGAVTGTPAISVPLSLPWTTGDPYSLYARVRTHSKTGVSAWSTAFGFNMRAPDAPRQLSGYPGLVRWESADGATSYQVWYTDVGKIFSSLTTSADEREFYTFHQLAPWPSLVH